MNVGVDREKDPVLTRALVVWTHWESASSPKRDDAAIVQEFGESLGLDLVAAVHRLEDDFYYRSRAHDEVPELVDMGKRAGDEFRLLHPEIGEDGVQALQWCYTFDYK